MAMPTVILLMIFGAAAFSYWNASRAAAEHAERLGRNACSAADVILLDQTVQASGIRLRRNEDGRLGFERSFRFEYSRDGSDRHTGSLSLLGGELVRFVGPVREAGQTNSLNLDDWSKRLLHHAQLRAPRATGRLGWRRGLVIAFFVAIGGIGGGHG